MSILHAVELAGTAVFAITGALAAGRKRMDVFGVVVLGCVTALGGGTLRDLILDAEQVFWVADTFYLGIAAIAAAATFGLAQVRALPERLLEWADAIGLGAFAVIGFQRGYDETGLYTIGIVMGVVTSVVGGMLRDVLADEIPFVLRREVYASACLIGAALYAALVWAHALPRSAPLLAAGVTIAIRLYAMRRHASLPRLELDDEDAS